MKQHTISNRILAVLICFLMLFNQLVIVVNSEDAQAQAEPETVTFANSDELYNALWLAASLEEFNAIYNNGTYNNVTYQGVTAALRKGIGKPQSTNIQERRQVNSLIERVEAMYSYLSAPTAAQTTIKTNMLAALKALPNYIAPATAPSIPTGVTWKSLPSTGGVLSGYYKLNSDVNLSLMIQVEGTLVIDLNGYVLSCSSGGNAILVDGTNGSGLNTTCTIVDSNPTKANQGRVNSNGVWIYKGTSGTSKVIYGGVITGDDRASYGGSIKIHGGTLILNGGTLTGNTKHIPKSTDSTKNATYGGGVAVRESGRFVMNGGTICNNIALIGGGVTVQSGSFEMNGGTICENTSYFGGGVYVYPGQTFTMNGGTITNNKAIRGSKDSPILSTKIQDKCLNEINKVSGYGGAVYCRGTITINGGRISNNSAIDWGGGLFVGYYSTPVDKQGEQAATINMTGGTISHNVGGSGGGLITYAEGNYKVTFNMSGGNIIGNESSYAINPYASGGGMFLEKTNMTLSGGTIGGNTAARLGGGVNINATTTFNVEGTPIIEQNLANFGGAFSQEDGECKLVLDTNSNLQVRYNRAKGSGGGLFIEKGILTLNSGVFEYNVAEGSIKSGEAAETQSGSLNDNLNEFGCGGAIYLYPKRGSISADINGCIIRYNKAEQGKTGTTGNGGGIYAKTVANTSNSVTVNLKSGTLQFNSAKAYGGGVCLEMAATATGAAKINVGHPSCADKKQSEPIISGNTAVNGGALAIVNHNTTAASIDKCAVNFYCGEMTGNTATVDGGAVYVQNGNYTMGLATCNKTTSQHHHPTAKGNTATNGGAIAVNGGSATVYCGILGATRDAEGNLRTGEGNVASNRGGAVYIKNGNFTMPNWGSLTGNTALIGGAINVDGGNVTIGEIDCHWYALSNGKIEDTSKENYLEDGDLDHAHPELSGNEAALGGGGIAVTGGTTNMYCGEVKNNLCTSDQSRNNYYQEGTGSFDIWGGELDIGVDIVSGSFTDHRPEDYIVTFHAYYDGACHAETKYAASGIYITLPDVAELNHPAFDRDGKTLFGWSISQDVVSGFMLCGSTHYVTGNQDLYAVWVDKTYDIEYDLNYEGAPTLAGEYYTTTDSEIYHTLQVPTRTGYAFDGWDLTQVGSEGNWEDQTVNSTLKITAKYGDIKLTARWTPKEYIITYDYDGGIDPGNPGGFNGTEYPTLTNPQRPGYEFKGWLEKQENGTYVAFSGFYAAKNYHLKAKWEIKSYTVTFRHADESYTLISEATYTIESGITLPTATKDGHKLKAWKAQPTGDEGNWTQGEEYRGQANKYGNVTLYAVWEKVETYSLVFKVRDEFPETNTQPFIVRLKKTDGTVDLTFVVTRKEPVTVTNLPGGTYTVTVSNEWAWRHPDGNPTATFTVPYDPPVTLEPITEGKIYWLSDYDVSGGS